MSWPSVHEVFTALERMPRTPIVNGLLQMNAMRLGDNTLLIDVIAYDVAVSANDIPNPRLTHAGPWTPGWTPL